MNTQIINNILYTVITGFATVIVGFLVVLLQNKLKEYTNKIKNKNIKEALNQLSDIIGKAIIDTSENFTNKLKDNGEWTNESAKIALDKSLETVKAQLNKDMTNYIKEKYNDIDVYLKSTITAMYEEQKKKIAEQNKK